MPLRIRSSHTVWPHPVFTVRSEVSIPPAAITLTACPHPIRIVPTKGVASPLSLSPLHQSFPHVAPPAVTSVAHKTFLLFNFMAIFFISPFFPVIHYISLSIFYLYVSVLSIYLRQGVRQHRNFLIDSRLLFIRYIFSLTVLFLPSSYSLPFFVPEDLIPCPCSQAVPIPTPYRYLPPPASTTYLHVCYLPPSLPSYLPSCLPDLLTCLPSYSPSCLPECLPIRLLSLPTLIPIHTSDQLVLPLPMT